MNILSRIARRVLSTGSRTTESTQQATGFSEAPADDPRWQEIADQLEGLTSEAPISEAQREQSLEIFSYSFRTLLDALPSAPQKDLIVLEAGVGRFGWAHLFGKFFDKVYGLDIEDYSAFHPNVEFVTSDLTGEIPLPDQSVDLVVCYSVLEHVLDVPAALANFDRILKTGGHLHLTVDPLYYSAEGAHIYGPKPLTTWEHLNPQDKHYLLGNPLPDADTEGHVLNKMTYADFLGWVGRFPWSILSSQIGIDGRPVPDFVVQDRWSEMRLRNRGFNLVARKEWHVAATGSRRAAA